MMLSPAKSKRRARQEIDNIITRMAPTLGWNARDPEAAMRPGYALQLDNWWPATNQIEIRKGATDHATGLSTAVKSLMVWNGATGSPRSRLFGSTNAGIYDCTTAGAVGAVASALTNGACQSANYQTTGGAFLFVVNGTDSLRYYDGSTWTTVASFSINGGGTLNTTSISNINVFKRSLFFIETNSMNFYYLPIDSIAGNVSRFPLGGLFNKGGYLIAMGTWSVDGGDGVDDYAVFVTSVGQVALYKGTDPSSASTWALQGVYDMAAPLGPKCFTKFGGDLLYLSRTGLYPLAKALMAASVNSKVAVSDRIAQAFTNAAATYGGNDGWQSVYSLSDSLLLINVPTTSFSSAVQFVMNTTTQAWARITNWDATSWALLDNQLYMGMVGKVAKAWYQYNDFGAIISAYAKTAFDDLGMAGGKHPRLVRPVLKFTGQVSVDMAMDTDYADGTEYGPSVFQPPEGSLWDSAVWVADGGSGSTWAADATPRLNWITLACNPCYVAAARLRVLAKDATVAWTATDFALERGAILT